MLQLRHPARQGPQRRLQHCQCRGGASPSVAGIPLLQAGEDVKVQPSPTREVYAERNGQGGWNISGGALALAGLAWGMDTPEGLKCQDPMGNVHAVSSTEGWTPL